MRSPALLVLGVMVATVTWLAREKGSSLAGSGTELQVCGPSDARSSHPGMVFVPGGEFTMGADSTLPEEGPASYQAVAGFWMDRTEVTNAEFGAFVAATGYSTLAERGVRVAADPASAVVSGSVVFRAPGEGGANGVESWWKFVPGANWRAPDGPGSTSDSREHYPVVHVAWEDAVAYAAWVGRSLPTEAQFEYAAQSSRRVDASGEHVANTWQGLFPIANDVADGYAGAAPVACYSPNKRGIYDLIGNVWEWTTSAYYPRHDFAATAEHPDGFDPSQPGEAVAVLKGGSYLCAPNYCMRYRPEARIGQSKGLGASHIGFRTVLNEE